MAPQVRQGKLGDVPALTEIHNWYIENSIATFDVAPWTLRARRDWFTQFTAQGRCQLLVAETQGRVAGYACGLPYRTHRAFEETVETSVYVHPDFVGQRLGGLMYDVLLPKLAAAGVHVAVAGVALPNEASVALHLSRGFREVGMFAEYARKESRYISSVWFERLFTASA